MAPSATETVVPVIEALKQKVVPETQAKPEKAPEDLSGGAVGSALIDDDLALPKLEINHREPLKLSGALDQFKYFDSTPVIGREFVDVDLAEWLRAPNSDELIRDLAITSKKACSIPLFLVHVPPVVSLNDRQHSHSPTHPTLLRFCIR
jgi:hypothetical protein